MRGFHAGTVHTSNPPSTANTKASSIGANAGRTSSVPSNALSSSCAWISLPGIDSPSGVAWYSPNPSAGHADDDQLLQPLRVDPAFEDVDRRHEACAFRGEK